MTEPDIFYDAIELLRSLNHPCEYGHIQVDAQRSMRDRSAGCRAVIRASGYPGTKRHLNRVFVIYLTESESIAYDSEFTVISADPRKEDFDPCKFNAEIIRRLIADE